MSARIHSILLILSLVSCVSYERDETSPEIIASAVAARQGGTFSVEAAIELAMRQNPRLRSLAAKVHAADASMTVPLLTNLEARGRSKSIAAMVDPVALLGLGPRGAAIDVAETRLVEAIKQLAVARWHTAASIVEEFHVHTVLNQLQVADIGLDIDAFEQSGLASPLAALQLQAAQAKAQSERVAIATARSNNLTRLRNLLALPDSAELKLLAIPDGWIQQPEGTNTEILLRPDIALYAAKFEVADAEFKEAVAAQYPSAQIGPNVSLTGDPLRAMAMIRLPIGMHGLAEAARQRREAARTELEAVFLEAVREASINSQRFAATSALATATNAAKHASNTAIDAGRIAIEVELDAFANFAILASTAMHNTMENRQAAIANARAEVRRAAAYGWPNAQLLGEAATEQEQQL